MLFYLDVYILSGNQQFDTSFKSACVLSSSKTSLPDNFLIQSFCLKTCVVQVLRSHHKIETSQFIEVEKFTLIVKEILRQISCTHRLNFRGEQTNSRHARTVTPGLQNFKKVSK